MCEVKSLKEYLLSDEILLYENEIFEMIPELKREKGFEQRSEWHCFDVWRHTIATINACEKNFEDRLVMLLHDVGKPFSYQDEGNIRHFKGHAMKSAEIAENILDRLNVSLANKKNILELIRMHSSKIIVENISLENMNFYRRLLKIQRSDAHGYEPSHSLQILKQLDITEKKINEICLKIDINKQLNDVEDFER